jgi:quercetin dioxygenase-like cupin family protein
MSKTPASKGIAISMADAVGYADDAVISKTLLDKPTGTLTLFSFDAGQGLSEHTSPYDATVQILEGAAAITIDGKTQHVTAGNLVIMPANVPHALKAEERFKMLLIMIR